MSESNDYTPAPHYRGHSFHTAYKAFDRNAGRAYAKAIEENTDASQYVPNRISTKSSHPWFLRCDFSGSMGGWPNPIVAKWPYVDHEVRTEYLGADSELSIGAHADSADRYPMQIQDFQKEAGVQTATDKLMFTGGGGGSDEYHEAHGLVALYDCRNADIPNAIIKPPYIMITDEMAHPTINKDDARRIAKVSIDQTILHTSEVFEELMEKYSVYIIVKPYHDSDIIGDKMSGTTQRVFQFWAKLVGIERVALLPDPKRVVDVIFGILAKETGKISYFREELEQRQLPDKGGRQKVDTVYKSLKTIHLLPPPDKKSGDKTRGHSKTTGLDGAKKTKRLMD